MKWNRFIWQYLLGTIGVVWLIISYTPYNDFVANCIRGVGIALVIVGVIGRLYATMFIGGMKNEGADGNSFIDYGAYSLCRNPLYLFSFIGFLGILALKAQLILIILGGILFLWIYRMTILGEENFLSQRFGEKYQQFLQNTSRFFPSFAHFSCPEKIEVRPKFFHKELRRALNWFIGVVAILVIEVLHNYEILPIFYMMY